MLFVVLENMPLSNSFGLLCVLERDFAEVCIEVVEMGAIFKELNTISSLLLWILWASRCLVTNAYESIMIVFLMRLHDISLNCFSSLRLWKFPLILWLTEWIIARFYDAMCSQLLFIVILSMFWIANWVLVTTVLCFFISFISFFSWFFFFLFSFSYDSACYIW